MSDNVPFRKKFLIQGGDFLKAGEVSIKVKNILREIGFNPEVIRRVAIASYEAEMNVVMYGREGEFNLTIKPDRVLLSIKDNGPGIPDVKLAMKEGYSTATREMQEMGFGAGMGLPNMKKNSDVFKIVSKVNHGTCIEMKIRAA